MSVLMRLPSIFAAQYRNVFDDVKAVERLGLVEKDSSGHFYVPLTEIDATFRLAA